MALIPTTSIELGFSAPEFNLVDPITNTTSSLTRLKGKNGTLVMFICNHCPFVIHIIDAIVSLANEYQKQGISFIAINSNDVSTYPEDAPEKMVDFAKKHSISFPYLFDESQEIAKKYDAACTPDFNLIDTNGSVIYRGRFDAARPGNNLPADGHDMKDSMDRLLAGKEQISPQMPSIGCNIKWK